MSYYEDQEDAWEENDFIGDPSDYDPYDGNYTLDSRKGVMYYWSIGNQP